MARRKPTTIDVLQARAADSPGYVRLLLSDAVGSRQAGELVTVDLAGRDGGTCELMLHGQRELDVPGPFVSVTFPDGSVYTPPA